MNFSEPGGSRHVYLLSLVLALAYLLIILYASVQPFRGWRLPAHDVYSFLSAPWPRYITLIDVSINVCAYIPLGFMLTLGLRLALPVVAAVAAGVVLAFGVSVAMESIQMFLPARIASNVDVLANSAGGLIGALAAPLFQPARGLGKRLSTWRNRLFLPGAMTDIGIVVIGLWIVTHLNPLTQVFSTGNLRQTFDLPVYFFHTPGLFLFAEFAVVGLNLLGIGLLLSTLMRAHVHRRWVIAAAILAALSFKMVISGVSGKPLGPWAWVTPGALLGVCAGGGLLMLLIGLGHTVRLLCAMISFVIALAAINLAPDNPYFSLPPQLASGRLSHFLSFSAILRALSELWPIIAISYLCTAAWRSWRYGNAAET